MSCNGFQPEQEQKHDDEFSEHSQNVHSIRTQNPEFMDGPIHAAIDFIFKKQRKIEQQIIRKEATIAKTEQHIIASTVPRDLNFKFSGYKQFPLSISEEAKAAVNTRAISLFKDTLRLILEERLQVLKEDLVQTKTTLCTTDQHWIAALHMQLPVLYEEPRLSARANQLLQAALVSKQLQESIRAERKAHAPQPVQPANTSMAIDSTAESINSLTAALQKLQRQVDSISHHPNRLKNGFGSGFASTDHRRNHAARGRSTSQITQSRSRTPRRRRSTSRPRRHSHDNTAPPRRDSTPARRSSDTRRTPQRSRSGQTQHRATAHTPPSRSTARSRSPDSRPRAPNQGNERRHGSYSQHRRRK